MEIGSRGIGCSVCSRGVCVRGLRTFIVLLFEIIDGGSNYRMNKKVVIKSYLSRDGRGKKQTANRNSA